MRLSKLHTIYILSLCAVIAACSDTDVCVDAPLEEGKTPIMMSVGAADAATTRAVITDGTGKTMSNFDINTKIFMIMKSEKEVDGSGNTVTHGGYEYQGDRDNTLYTVCRGDVAANTNAVKFNATNQRYWDDVHARSSQLTIWAYAQKGMPWTTCTFEVPNAGGSGIDAYKGQPYNTATAPSPVWSTTEIYPAIRTWRACHYEYSDNQDATSIQCQDLFFTNNIADNTFDSKGDTRLRYDFINKHFPTTGNAELKFYHAMSKITIQIKAGDGFKADGTDFQFSNGNVRLSRVNKKGLFNIKTGRFEWIWETQYGTDNPDPNPYVIPQIYLKSTNQAKSPDVYYTLEALVIPNIIGNNGMTAVKAPYSRFVKDESEVMMDFTIDHNHYQITSDALFEAITGKTNATTVEPDAPNPWYVPLEAGKNYVFTFTIGKQKIDNITACVADWEEVTASEITPTNARITLNVEDRSVLGNTSPVTDNMDIYRALDEAASVTDDHDSYKWKTKYTIDGKATWNGNPLTYNTDRWSTDWYWENNKAYYHFRTLSPTTQVVTQDAENGDYTAVTSASCSGEANYSQMAWGAPFLDVADDYKFTYDPIRGFDGTGTGHQIYKAIGPTEEQVKVLMFHMMSGVHFTIATTGGTDKVELYHAAAPAKRTTVQLVGYYPDGRVYIGDGHVVAVGTQSTEGSPYDVSCATTSDGAYTNQEYYFSAVPQDLTSVKLRISTPDNNQYIVNLTDIKAPGTSITNHNIANPYTQVPESDPAKYTINRWYPGFKYNYTLRLSKTGITNLQATIANWETVAADEEGVQIK